MVASASGLVLGSSAKIGDGNGVASGQPAHAYCMWFGLFGGCVGYTHGGCVSPAAMWRRSLEVLWGQYAFAISRAAGTINVTVLRCTHRRVIVRCAVALPSVGVPFHLVSSDG